MGLGTIHLVPTENFRNLLNGWRPTTIVSICVHSFMWISTPNQSFCLRKYSKFPTPAKEKLIWTQQTSLYTVRFIKLSIKHRPWFFFALSTSFMPCSSWVWNNCKVVVYRHKDKPNQWKIKISVLTSCTIEVMHVQYI